jgi:hypothetical protein
LAYEVVHCSECGKPIKSAPLWLHDVKVEFTCESCRQKHPKPVAGYDPIPAAPKATIYSDDDTETPDGVEVVDDDDVIDEDLDEPDAPLVVPVEE